MSVRLGATTRCWRPGSSDQLSSRIRSGDSSSLLAMTMVSASTARMAACRSASLPSTGIPVPGSVAAMTPEGMHAPTTW